MNPNTGFYTKCYLFFFFIASFFLLHITPPFQSPDEVNHVARAYSLSEGDIVLNKGEVNIDNGFIAFQNRFSNLPSRQDQKVTADMLFVEEVWQGQKSLMGIANTAVYFPAVYLPQSVALTIGDWFHFSVNKTYYLAKIFSLLTCTLLLYVANRIYQTPAAVSVLFLLPMVVFQASSASQDALVFSASAVIAALICKGIDKNRLFGNKEFVCLLALLFVVLTARINLMPLALLPLLVAYVRNEKKWYVYSLINIAAMCVWVLIAYKAVGSSFHHGLSVMDKVKFFVENPSSLLAYFWSTFTDKTIMKGYLHQFIGVLGWLDVSLKNSFYNFTLLVLFAIGLFSMGCKWKVFWKNSISGFKPVIFFAVLCCVLLTFLLLLLAWTNILRLSFIDGVQGRYFIPLAIISSYVLFSNIKLKERNEKIIFCLIFVFFCYSLANTSVALNKRYYMYDTQPQTTSVQANH